MAQQASHFPMSPSGSGESLPSLTRPFSQNQVAELKEAFGKFDLNNDGRISKSELESVLRQLGLRLSDGDIELMVKEADMDGDGFIDMDEFLQLNAAAESLDRLDSTELLKEVFEVFDKDKNGVICAEELHSVMMSLTPRGEQLTVDECRQMIQRVDGNGDGVVDFMEFQTMMTATDLLPCSS